jgi:two-component system LytT family response regulator
MLKAIIVDDESRARKILASFLTDYCEQVEIVAQVEDVPQGVKAIKKFEPDIVFRY